MRIRIIGVLSLLLLSSLLFVNCGGGGGGQPPSGTSYYDIGGVVSGLTGTGSIDLQNNGGDDLTVAANGNFRFATRLTSGAAYSVSIVAAPIDQNCSVFNASGTVPGANVTSVVVLCQDIPLVSGPAITSLDAYEPDNDIFTSTSTISVGDSQLRTLFNEGDVDIVKVDLNAGTLYEIAANRLSAGSDTYMYLIDTDQTTTLVSETTGTTEDDYLGLGSMFRTTPTTTGTYFIEVMSYKHAQNMSGASGDPSYGIATYTLSVHTVIDTDGDGVSAYYDCKDNDASIFPWNVEIPGDGIDQDCSGADEPPATTADKAEPDNDKDHAREIVQSAGDPFEIRYRQDIFTGNGRTIHKAGDRDWFTFTLPAHGAAELSTVIDKVGGANHLQLSVYEADGATLVTGPSLTNPISDPVYGIYMLVSNPTASAATYYAVFEADNLTRTGFYVPYLIPLGVDADGDTFYTLDFYLGHDCDDSDVSIFPFSGVGSCP